MVRGLGPQVTSSTSTSRFESHDRGTSDMPSDSDETQPASPTPSASSRAIVLPLPRNEHISYAPDGRVILYRSLANNLFPTATIRGAATAAFKKKQEPAGYNWKSVSNSMKETYWGELQKVCCWDEGKLSTSLVRSRWDKVAAKAYKDFVCGVKKKVEKGNLDKIQYVRPEVLDRWKIEWEKPEVKAKSETAKRNRRSGPDGPGTGPVVHHGGSRNAELHALDEAKAKGIDFEHTGLATHYRLHCVAGVWTDARAKYIYDETMRRVDEERRPLPGEVEEREVPPSRVEEIYREVSKVDAKGNMFGKGILSQMYAEQCGKRRGDLSSTQFHSQHEGRIVELETRLKAQEHEMEERLKAQEQEMEEKLRAQKKEMETLFKKQEEERVEKENELKYQLLAFQKSLESMGKYFSQSQGHENFDFSLPPPFS